MEDPYFSNVSLLLPFDGTNGSTVFTDASSNGFVGAANGTAQISTTDPKFGTGCLLLDGAGDFVSYSHNAALSVNNVFTIEAWVRFDAFNAGDTDTILSKWANAGSSANDEFLLYYSVDKLYFDFRDSDGSTYRSVSSSAVSLSTGTYYYFAVSRNGSSWTFNVNGTTSTATNSSTIRNTGGYAMMVGRVGGYTLYDLNGRIDELRLTKGVARDISIVPTAPFATSGPPPTDPYFSDVSLLLPMDGTNGSTTITDASDNDVTVTVNGGAQISTAQSKYGGSSLYLQRSVSSSITWTETAFGTNDFTVEFWLRVSDFSARQTVFQYGSSGNQFNYWIDTSGNLWLFSEQSPFGMSEGNLQTLSTNTWYYIAVCLDGNTVRPFVDGVAKSTTIWNNSFSATNFSVGGKIGGTEYVEGYVDDLRITNGVARYTAGTFTPPAAAFPTSGPPATDPDFSDVSLLLPMNGENGSTFFGDASLNNLVATANGSAQISTAQSKWGGSSLLLDGTGDYLSVPDNNVLDFDTGDFTIECWARFTTLTNAPFIFYKGNSVNTDPGWWLEVSSSTSYFGFQTNGSTFWAQYTVALTTGVWYHLACCRVGSTLYYGVDGTVQSATVSGADLSKDNTNALLIGSYNPISSAFDLNGHIQDFRVTKGVARYTANFTPPTAAFYTGNLIQELRKGTQLIWPPVP